MQQLPVDETIRAALKKTHARLHRQHELVVEFGVMSLKAADLDLLLTRACEVVAEGMSTRFSKVLQPAEDGEGEGFVLTHGVGWDASDIGRATVGGDVASPAGYALATYRPVLSNHLGMENRFRTPELLKKYGIERAINVPIRGLLSPFGVLEADSSNGDDFVESDLVFLEGISNVISMAVERISAGVDVPVPDPYSETILNASPDWVDILAPNGEIEFMNEAGLTFLDTQLTTVKGQRWYDLWPEESRSFVWEAVAKVSAGETMRFESYCPIAPDEPKWWDVTVAPILGADGKVERMIAVSRDITERHQYEAQLLSLIEAQNSKQNRSDLYLEEIHHRVKNSLHLVNTLLLLQANLTPDAAVKLQLETAAGRVVTIATVHERLYQAAEDQELRARDYLTALLGDLGRALAERKIVLDADEFVLPSERMAPLGLVISELITNALKYGKGNIEVAVKHAGDHALLTVRDEGDGFPDNYPKPTGTGLGMRLVKSYSGYGSAAVEVDRQDSKSCIHVRFKL
ncbi:MULTISPECIES: histidine kinase dimerization/phosphoacceptor domain -containing protein [Pseudomonas]|jgi:two-component system, sensor histidine kinase PdtaS|uniref:histidine kinase n=3 Tax=root TaxID=1 RepID=A0A1X0ZQG0_PSEPU|nr:MULTISPECIES: histidine kinase dimerization/phosphoacceptor domain -containing protein [Pseudomonas]PNB53393.1 PAS domain-containing protein [Pseudomonas sp. FW305-130]PTC01647.1 PAS domain-containing protein [Thalassospira xiamenensis]EKT4562400.1 PAS domain-containing protein [Pseudomonas putida]KYC17340.1 histidine kinase [Pseudomonas sp. ABFPK]MBA6106053.1 PAS domain-containing protein [Pseudomonas monteilii]